MITYLLDDPTKGIRKGEGAYEESARHPWQATARYLQVVVGGVSLPLKHIDLVIREALLLDHRRSRGGSRQVRIITEKGMAPDFPN